jgi:hypothetical protein
LYDEDQRLLENGLMKTPSLNLQKSGTRLQDAFIFDPTMRDLTACPVCHHVSTQILECQLAKCGGDGRGGRGVGSVTRYLYRPSQCKSALTFDFLMICILVNMTAIYGPTITY